MKKTLLRIFSLVFLFCMAVQLFTFPYVESSDGLSLFNPVYMGKFYNRIVYPAYYYYDNMPVHPPVYYYFMSLLYKAGLPVFYVIKAPVLICLAVFVFAVALSRLSYAAKFSALLAVVVAVERAGAFITFRPDIVLSLVFLASLVCLHEGTRTHPKTVWLLAGSVLIGLSSTLHYFGIMGVAGTLLFATKIIAQDGWRKQLTPLLYLFVPAALIVGGYLLFIILPNAQDVIHGIRGPGVGGRAVTVHYQMYRDWFGNSPLRLLLYMLPIAGWLLVAAFFNREMRTLYLGAVPFVWFVFLIPAGKSAGYYIAELALFYWMLFHFMLHGLFMLFGVLKPFLKNALTYTVLAYVAFVACTGHNLDRHDYEVGSNKKANGCEMFTARACAKNILGNNAKVGSRLDLWFNTGAAHWYQLSQPLFLEQRTDNKNIRSVFGRFDAIAEYRLLADKGERPDRYTLSGWYEDDTLKLKGFYLSNNYKAVPYFPDNDPSYLLFSANRCDTVKGYMAYNNEQVFSLVTDSLQPTHYFLSLVVSDSLMRDSLFNRVFEMYTRFIYLNTKAAGDKWLVWGVAKANAPLLLAARTESGMRVKDMVPVRRRAESKAQLLNYKDSPIKFYKSLDSLSAGLPYY